MCIIINGIFKDKNEIIWDKTKPDGTLQKLLDVSKLNDLGWKERVKLKEGIESVYSIYNNIKI